jgi:cystine transport system ATP-binding protein
MTLISVRGIRKAFGDLVVLHDVSLDVEQGSVTVLIGPSGSGKTTLLRCLNALERPEAGTIRVGDVTIDCSRPPARNEAQQLRGQSGMVFQAHHLFPHRTALENVTEGPIHVQKLPVATAREQGRDLLARVGLADKADAYPHQLSGGQQQRVGIARALALRPQLILFDEPTSALDPETVGDVLTVMRNLADDGWTMVVVTHEIQFAEQVADHVAFLDAGVIIEEGPPSQVLAAPTQPRTQQFLRRILDPLSQAAPPPDSGVEDTQEPRS